MTWAEGAITAACGIGSKILWDFLTRGRSSNGNGKAGEQPRVYYDARFDKIDDRLSDIIERQKGTVTVCKL